MPPEVIPAFVNGMLIGGVIASIACAVVASRAADALKDEHGKRIDEMWNRRDRLTSDNNELRREYGKAMGKIARVEAALEDE